MHGQWFILYKPKEPAKVSKISIKYLRKDKVNCLTLLLCPSCCRDHSNHPLSFHS